MIITLQLPMDTLTRDEVGFQHEGVYLTKKKHCYHSTTTKTATKTIRRINEADLRVNCYNFSATATNHQDSFQPLCQHLQELHVWISRCIITLTHKMKADVCIMVTWSVNSIRWIFYKVMEMLWKVCKLESLQLSKYLDLTFGLCDITWWNMNRKYQILMKITFQCHSYIMLAKAALSKISDDGPSRFMMSDLH